MLTADAIGTQQKWEYCLLTRKSEGYILNDFNTLGQEGWELVPVMYYKDFKGIMCWTGFLKRPSSGQASKPAGHETAATLVQPAKSAAPSPDAKAARSRRRRLRVQAARMNAGLPSSHRSQIGSKKREPRINADERS